jgi:deoxyadenosine/deoxycytidine kinase
MQEPVDDWLEFKDKKGETIISKFYGNQEKYAFSFQMMAYISRISKLKKLVKEVEKNPKSIIICERCVLTDRNVFAKMLYDDKKIEEIDYQIYNKWFDEFIEDIPIDGLIYVKAEPEVSYNRVMKRNREGEVIPLEYLRNCHNYHNTWIEKENTNVLCLDANSDFDYNLDDYKQWINKIDNFVENKEELYETTVSNMMDITYC